MPVINEALGRNAISCVPESGEIMARKNAKYCVPTPAIDAIAVTVGPGLITSLLVGVETARTCRMLGRFLWWPSIILKGTSGRILCQ